MQYYAKLSTSEPAYITQHDIHPFQLTHDDIRSLDLSSRYLTDIIQRIIETHDPSAFWAHILSIVIQSYLSEPSEIHFQSHVITPIQKALSPILHPFFSSHPSDESLALSKISYIISLFIGGYGWFDHVQF